MAFFEFSTFQLAASLAASQQKTTGSQSIVRGPDNNIWLDLTGNRYSEEQLDALFIDDGSVNKMIRDLEAENANVKKGRMVHSQPLRGCLAGMIGVVGDLSSTKKVIPEPKWIFVPKKPVQVFTRSGPPKVPCSIRAGRINEMEKAERMRARALREHHQKVLKRALMKKAGRKTGKRT